MSILPRLFKVTSPNKVGLLPEPHISGEVSAHIPAGSCFVVTGELENDTDQRGYVKVGDSQGWVAKCSRKDATRAVVAEVDNVAYICTDPSSRLFLVTSDKKVGVLPEPDVRADVVSYLIADRMFFVSSTYDSEVDGRRYLRLSNNSGWVAESSRKDPHKLVTREVQLFRNRCGTHHANSRSQGDDHTGIQVIAEGIVDNVPSTPEKLVRKRSHRDAFGDLSACNVTPKRVARVTSLIGKAFARFQRSTFSFHELLAHVNEGVRDESLFNDLFEDDSGNAADSVDSKMTKKDFRAVIDHLDELNKVMILDDQVTLVG